MTTPIDEARDRLRSLIPHLEIAAKMAAIELGNDAEPTFWIGAQTKDEQGTPSGKSTAHFRLTDFLADLKTLVGEEEL